MERGLSIGHLLGRRSPSGAAAAPKEFTTGSKVAFSNASAAATASIAHRRSIHAEQIFEPGFESVRSVGSELVHGQYFPLFEIKISKIMCDIKMKSSAPVLPKVPSVAAIRFQPSFYVFLRTDSRRA
jgi:hypothetical protein